MLTNSGNNTDDSIVEIIKSVKAEFPLVFGAKDLVSSDDFYQAYNAVAEHSIRATDPPLKSVTHKHQWTLMGAAIGLIALVLFKVGKIKVADAVINVDRQVVKAISEQPPGQGIRELISPAFSIIRSVNGFSE